MTPDLVAELMRQLMREAMIVAAPLLIAAAALSFVLSLIQTLTSLQEQSLTSVPRLAPIALILLVGMPWFLERLATTRDCCWATFTAIWGEKQLSAIREAQNAAALA
jgi:flagellar biosynthesis protein FliQ